MKGCLKFFAIAAAIVVGGFVILGLGVGAWTYSQMTPEQRASMKADRQADRQAEQQAAKQAAQDQKAADIADQARIEALKPEFITWLQKNAGATTGRFDGDVLEVKFDHGWTSPDAARVKAEALARAWRLRSRLDYAKCNIYWGNEIVGSGVSR